MGDDFEVCPPRSKRLKTDVENTDKRVLYVVLEQCSLESAKIGKDYVLLASEKHANFLLKNKKDPATYRPDIVHQCLLNLLDSPLNRAGKLQVFIHTDMNVLIEVNPQCRIPRTYDRFAGLMVQLLHKLSLRASDSSQKLLNVIKNPVSEHLPVGCRKILLSFSAPDLTIPNKMVATTENMPIAVVVGGIAKGRIDTDYTDTEMKISNYPLSAALTCAKITSGLEEIWGIM
ncbi:unnamed protein product, partial [Mesorhabditis belari]|uniref:18S rRNA (pseudouridine-N1)-methyltransferase n=1 Tax=Mesorhabditis belari TaxID=2138241 RepID=A0AAF3EBA8_9BILA